MDKKTITSVFCLIWIIFCFNLWSCHRPQATLTVVGSTSVQPFAEILAEEFMKRYPQEKIFVQGGGSSAGIQAVMSEACPLGMSSRNLTPAEKTLLAIPIAYDAIAVIVHRQNPLTNLTKIQIQKIFSGQIKNWQELGGENRSITLVTREEGSGTREAFQHLIMEDKEISLAALVQDSNGAIRQVVGDDAHAIGYISLGLLNEKVKAVQIDGVEPNLENIRRQRYKIVRPFLFVLKKEPTGVIKDFLNFILSADGQKILAREGLMPVTTLPDKN
ncbi:MAG: phosphate ABC transporter substrate-binding protein [Thermodesulfobacteriota bacterium]